MFVLLYNPGQLRQRWGENWRSSPKLRRWVLNTNDTDTRLYFIPSERSVTNAERRWEVEARGEKSIWDDADELLLEMQLTSMALTERKVL